VQESWQPCAGAGGACASRIYMLWPAVFALPVQDPQARFDAALQQAQEHGRRLGAPQAAARARVLAQQAGGRTTDRRVRFGLDAGGEAVGGAAARSSVDEEEDTYGDELVDSLLEMEAAGDDYEGLLVGRGTTGSGGGGGQRSSRVQALARAAARRTGWHAQAAAQQPSGTRSQGGSGSRGTSGPSRWASTIASLAPHDGDSETAAGGSVDEAVPGISDSSAFAADAAHAESMLQARIAAARAEQPSPSLGLSDVALASALDGADGGGAPSPAAAGNASAVDAEDAVERMVPRRPTGQRPLPPNASPEDVVRASMAPEVHRMAQAAAARVVDPDGDF